MNTLERWWPAAALVVALLLLASLPLGLNGDVQYVLGGLRAHDPGDPLRFVDTFTHRPIVYRGLMAALMDLLGIVGIHPSDMAVFEASLRLVAGAIAAGTGAVLWLGLRGRLGRPEAAAIGLACGLLLAVSPNFDFLQPEWFAAVFMALGVAAGIGARREVVGAVLGGALLTLAVAVKLATAPLAVAGVLLIGLVDRRRAVLTAVAGLVCGGAWVLLVRATPHEWRWMKEMASLNPHSPLRDMLGLTDAINAFRVLGSKLAVAPVLIMVPTSLVLLGLTLRGRARWGMPLVLLLVMGLAFSPLLAQAQWGLYHLAHLPVLGGGLVALAAVRWWRFSARPPWLLLVPMAALAAWTTVALAAPPEWRERYGLGVMVGLVLVGVLLPLATLALSDVRDGSEPAATPEARRSGVALALASLGAILVLGPALLPHAAWSLDSTLTPYTNAGWAERSRNARARLAPLVAEVPAGSSVLYLAYGDVAYHLGLPTNCDYPSPLWIQRAAFFGYVRSFDSYRDNLRCIAGGGEPYALLQPGWLRPTRIPAPAENLILSTFDCLAAPESAGVQVCRRR